MIGGTNPIYKAYFLGLCQEISPQKIILYGTVPPSIGSFFIPIEIIMNPMCSDDFPNFFRVNSSPFPRNGGRSVHVAASPCAPGPASRLKWWEKCCDSNGSRWGGVGGGNSSIGKIWESSLGFYRIRIFPYFQILYVPPIHIFVNKSIASYSQFL